MNLWQEMNDSELMDSIGGLIIAPTILITEFMAGFIAGIIGE